MSVSGTGTLLSSAATLFSAVWHVTPSPLTGLPIIPQLTRGTGLPVPPRLRTWTGYSLCQRAAPPASRLGLQVCGAGILTGYPSATPFGLTLGPAFPYADLPSVGSLGLPGGRFLTYLSLLMPGFSLLCSPSPLTGVTSPRRERSPTNLHFRVGSVASVLCFSPAISSARDRSTSELLRTP